MHEGTGQIERDIARLEELEDGTLAAIRIDGVITDVQLLKNRSTKIFAIVPSNVRTSLIEANAVKQGFRVEALGVPISRKELQDIVKQLVPIAKAKLANAPR